MGCECIVSRVSGGGGGGGGGWEVWGWVVNG